jgi:hypothetical protein
VKRALLALLVCAFLVACGDPAEPTTETTAAFQCIHVNAFTHVCTKWVPSLIPGSPTNNVPSGDPRWCVPAQQSIPVGWAEVLNYQPVADGDNCAIVPPGYYGTLGDWDYTSPLPNQIPSVHVRSMLTGPQAYLFVWDQPNFGGNFVGFYGPGSVVTFTSTVQSFELLLGQ